MRYFESFRKIGSRSKPGPVPSLFQTRIRIRPKYPDPEVWSKLPNSFSCHSDLRRTDCCTMHYMQCVVYGVHCKMYIMSHMLCHIFLILSLPYNEHSISSFWSVWSSLLWDLRIGIRYYKLDLLSVLGKSPELINDSRPVHFELT